MSNRDVSVQLESYEDCGNSNWASALNDSAEARFGRCAYFLIIDTDTMQFEAMENPNLALGGGAGIQSAQLMSEKGVKTVLTGNCGPNVLPQLEMDKSLKSVILLWTFLKGIWYEQATQTI